MSRKHSSAFALIERFAKEVKTYIRATRLETEAFGSAARADGSFADPTDGSVYAQRRILDDLLPARAEWLAARAKIISDAPALMKHLDDPTAMQSLLGAVERRQLADNLWPPVEVQLEVLAIMGRRAAKDRQGEDGGNHKINITFKRGEREILEAYNHSYPELLTSRQIAEDKSVQPMIGDRTVSTRIECLLKSGLIHRPAGKKSGATLTPQGLAVLQSTAQRKIAR
jgi:hypothetical protein